MASSPTRSDEKRLSATEYEPGSDQVRRASVNADPNLASEEDAAVLAKMG